MIRKIIDRNLNKNEQLLKHAMIIMAASLLTNIFNYLYQLYMGRALGPEKYGVLGALFSIVYIVGVVSSSITYTVSRFVTEYRAKEEYGKIKSILLGVLGQTALIGFIIFGLMAVFSAQLAGFLKIDNPALILMLCVYGIFSLLTPAFSGVLNGLQKFLTSGTISVFSTLAKLLFGVGLVYLGFDLFGALAGVIAASLLGLFLCLIALRKLFLARQQPIDQKAILKYAPYVFIGTVTPMFMINIDVILVKHFFPPLEAGFYSAASTIAKIVLFASGSLLTVIFPKASALCERGKSSSKLLWATLAYTLALSLILVAAYFIAPSLIVGLLYGSQYDIAGLIGPFGLAILLYSLVGVLIQYNLALKKKAFAAVLLFGLALELFGLLLFHQSLMGVIGLLLFVQLGLLIAMLLLTIRSERGAALA